MIAENSTKHLFQLWYYASIRKIILGNKHANTVFGRLSRDEEAKKHDVHFLLQKNFGRNQGKRAKIFSANY